MNKKSLRRQVSVGDLPTASPENHEILPTCSQSAPPTPTSTHEEQDLYKKKIQTKRLACAFKALKCSSRAFEEDNLSRSICPQTASHSEQHSEESRLIAYRMHAPLPPSTSDKRKENTRLLGNSNDDNIQSLDATALKADSIPFQDLDHEDEETAFQQKLSGAAPSSPPQVKGRDTLLDPPETPNISNRDPFGSEKKHMIGPKQVPDEAFDELCQRTFQNPRLTKREESLGDALLTPEYESDDCLPTKSMDSETRQHLELPSMNLIPTTMARTSFASTVSTSTSLLQGENIATTPSMTDDPHVTHAQPATGTMAESTRTRNFATREGLDNSYSFSSVSSFLTITKEEEDNLLRNRLPSRPPFFWRSHPNTTVQSNELQEAITGRIEKKENERFSYTSFQPNRRSSVIFNHGSMKEWIYNNHNPKFQQSDAMLQSFVAFASKKLPSVFRSGSE